jgi:hypothetical protein
MKWEIHSKYFLPLTSFHPHPSQKLGMLIVLDKPDFDSTSIPIGTGAHECLISDPNSRHRCPEEYDVHREDRSLFM